MTSFHLERNLPNMEKESQFKRKKKLLLDKVKYPKTRILKSSTKSGRNLVTLDYNNLREKSKETTTFL